MKLSLLLVTVAFIIAKMYTLNIKNQYLSYKYSYLQEINSNCSTKPFALKIAAGFH